MLGGRKYLPMKKEVKLVKKVKRLLRRLGCPRWLHHFGPKTYEFYEHITALLIRTICRLSYRRVKYFLDLVDIKCPSKSALHYTAGKISSSLWNKLLEITSGNSHYIVAIDGTGLSRVNPSYYYLRRIDGKLPKIHVKLSVAFDTAKKKFCAAKVRVLPAHDIRDAKYLLRKSAPVIVVADKGYDAYWLHKYCQENKIKAHIPIRNYSKGKHRNMGARLKAAKTFKLRTYHRRELIESGFGSTKRKFGASVSSKCAKTIKAEVYCKLICHNLFLFALWTFRTEPAG